jgi:hypothetical protein
MGIVSIMLTWKEERLASWVHERTLLAAAAMGGPEVSEEFPKFFCMMGSGLGR